MSEGQFARIGLHLDLRVQVLPIEALLRVAESGAREGFNTLIVEWEASFPFREHAGIANRFAYTRDEVRRLVEACAGWGIEVIPLQQCFGHVEYILRHPRYAALRESESDFCQVCPGRIEEASAVFSEIFREVAAAHPAPFFHIGGDETYLLGQCPACRAAAQARGASRLYVDYFKRLAAEVIRLGKRPLLWNDMLLKYPDAAAEMPPECIFIDWNYGWEIDRFGDLRSLAKLPFEFWGAVAMRSAPDNHSMHSWRAHLENFRDYIPVARSLHFRGIILTSWSTSGLYGYEWESPGRALSLYPIRRVLPHCTFPILVSAFAQAARVPGPLDVRSFLADYARARFGVTAGLAAKFAEALLSLDRAADPGIGLRQFLGRVRKALRFLRSQTPSRNALEWDRYQLSAELLENFLGRDLFEERTFSGEGAAAEREKWGRKIGPLLARGEELSERFYRLYEGELYPEELREEVAYRLKGARDLHARVVRSGREMGRKHEVLFPSREIAEPATVMELA